MGIEAALFGTAAVEGGAAATTGLLGTGGLFSFGTTLGTLGSALGLVGAAGSVIGGAQQASMAEQQARAAGASAEMRGKELARQSVEQSRIERERTKDIIRRQKLGFLKSGVSLDAGSPLVLMEETRRLGEKNIDEILAAGASGKSATLTEGRLRADALRQSGRASFISGITGGTTQLGNTLWRKYG
jgi:hypothetical protein